MTEELSKATTAPGVSVIKTLFALSGNRCSYTRCEAELTNPRWKEVAADIAHICGQKSTAPRFDPSLTPVQLHSFENLILLCTFHHRLVDRLEPERHSAEVLRKMKEAHESRAPEPFKWTTEERLTAFATMILNELRVDAPAVADEIDEIDEIDESDIHRKEEGPPVAPPSAEPKLTRTGFQILTACISGALTSESISALTKVSSQTVERWLSTLASWQLAEEGNDQTWTSTKLGELHHSAMLDDDPSLSDDPGLEWPSGYDQRA